MTTAYNYGVQSAAAGAGSPLHTFTGVSVMFPCPSLSLITQSWQSLVQEVAIKAIAMNTGSIFFIPQMYNKKT